MCFQSSEGSVWTLVRVAAGHYLALCGAGFQSSSALLFCSPNRKADSKLCPKKLNTCNPSLRRLR